MNTKDLRYPHPNPFPGCGSALRDAVASIVDRTIAWIEHDRERKVNGALPPLVTRDSFKQSPQQQTYPSLSNGQSSSGSHHNSSTDPSLSAGNDTPSSGIPSRGNYYGESAPENSSYPPIPYNDPAAHEYTAQDPYMFAQSGQVTASHVHSHQAHAHAQAQAQSHSQQPQGPIGDHNPLSTFAAQATSMQQPSPDMMWRQGTPAAAGNTWQDWTAAVVDNQDRYSANALMSLGAGARPSSVANDGVSSAPGMPGMTVGAMSGSHIPVTSNTQWPLLLFHEGPGLGGS